MEDVPTFKFDAPPDVYMIGDDFHIVDRKDGQVVCHKIYPADVIHGLADRASAVAKAAQMIGRMARRVRKEPRKRRK